MNYLNVQLNVSQQNLLWFAKATTRFISKYNISNAAGRYWYDKDWEWMYKGKELIS